MSKLACPPEIDQQFIDFAESAREEAEAAGYRWDAKALGFVSRGGWVVITIEPGHLNGPQWEVFVDYGDMNLPYGRFATMTQALWATRNLSGCQYVNIEHECDGIAAVRVWSDVRQAWSYGCRFIADHFGRQAYITEGAKK